MPSKRRTDLPRTAGELRRLIAEHGYSWTVDPRLRDSDPLPKRPRGGKPEESPPSGATLVSNVADYLSDRQPPPNPFLRERWVKLKLLKAQNRESLAGSSPNVADGAPKKAQRKPKEKKR